jgi:hypothetical protein
MFCLRFAGENGIVISGVVIEEWKIIPTTDS